MFILVSFLEELGLLFFLNYGIFFHKFLSKLISFSGFGRLRPVG